MSLLNPASSVATSPTNNCNGRRTAAVVRDNMVLKDTCSVLGIRRTRIVAFADILQNGMD